MFLHGWVSVRLMVASVIEVVRSRRMRWRRRYDEMGRRMRLRMTMGRRVKFGRTRVGVRRRSRRMMILTRRRGRMVRQLTGRSR
jgi:hypothetical protein